MTKGLSIKGAGGPEGDQQRRKRPLSSAILRFLQLTGRAGGPFYGVDPRRRS
jgi:hypothetical protein